MAQCFLGASGGSEPGIACDVKSEIGGTWIIDSAGDWIPASFDTWHTARIEADPATAELRLYVDGALVGTHTPLDAAALIVADSLQPGLGAWNDDADTSATRCVDDVRTTPADH